MAPTSINDINGGGQVNRLGYPLINRGLPLEAVAPARLH
jgi:hypothetical protein